MYFKVQNQEALGEVALSATQATGSLFRFDCSAGCHVFPPFPLQCRKVLHQAILDAIRLAKDAAGKLEARPRDSSTVSEFRFVFGHHPSLPVPSARKEYGAIVARRLRIAEKALREKGTFYRCDPCTATTDPPPGAILDVHAWFIPPNEVRLCPSFWKLSGFLRAGVLLHEMLHLVFGQLFDHDASERKRNSAYCYEVFALKVAGFAPERLAVNYCLARPA